MPHQAIRDAAARFFGKPDTDLVSIAETACALGINRNRMMEVPVARHPIDKKEYYLKGKSPRGPAALHALQTAY